MGICATASYSPNTPLTLQDVVRLCGNDIYKNPGREFKIFNKHYQGILYSQGERDFQDDRRVWVEPRRMFQNEGAERWYIINTGQVSNNMTEFKIFNKRFKGPLFNGATFGGDHNDYNIFCEDEPAYENAGKERWYLQNTSVQGEFRLINKCFESVLIQQDKKDERHGGYTWGTVDKSGRALGAGCAWNIHVAA